MRVTLFAKSAQILLRQHTVVGRTVARDARPKSTVALGLKSPLSPHPRYPRVLVWFEGHPLLGSMKPRAVSRWKFGTTRHYPKYLVIMHGDCLTQKPSNGSNSKLSHIDDVFILQTEREPDLSSLPQIEALMPSVWTADSG